MLFMSGKAPKASKVLGVAAGGASTSVLAQTPRGESSESMSDMSEGAVGAIWIFGALAIYVAFKKSQITGLKVLCFFGVMAIFYALFPGFALAIFGLIALFFAIILFVSML